jgi:WD40 repeat protein/tRNA A-37 threonylcarbamoyl transferase component Bud32
MKVKPIQQDELTELRRACVELRQRLRDGIPTRVEEMLERYPTLAQNDESVLELMHVEVTTRRDLGQHLSLAEWQDRFPRLMPRMEELISLQDSFTSELPTLSDAPAPKVEEARVGLRPGDGLPARIGNYQILSEIGRGGMGVVYKARQPNLRRIVALKMILAGEHAGLRERARLRKEAEAAAQITHPNVVQIIEVGEHDGLPFLTMEYVDGGNLTRMLRGTPQAFRWSARLTETLARAIHEAHARGIVHRDLNPSNVLMAADGTPKISDFGLAKFVVDDSGISQNGVILGTPSYMAPEQVSGNGKNIGPCTDVYALGALLYEMMTGTAPFRGFTPMETLCQVLEAEVVPPSKLRHGVPEDLETICLKCLQRDPSKRYSSAQKLAEDLRRFQESEPIRARRTTPLIRAIQWTKRQPLAAGLMGLCLVLFGSLLSVVLAYNVFLAEKNRQLEVGAEKELRVRNDMLTEQAQFRQKITQSRLEWYDSQLTEIKLNIEAGQLELAQELFENLRRSLAAEEEKSAGIVRGFAWYYLDRLLRESTSMMAAHEEEVTAITASRVGNAFLSGDRAGRILLWDLARPDQPMIFEGKHDAPVLKLALCCDESRLARIVASVSARDDGQMEIRLWDARTGEETSRLTTQGPGLVVKDLEFSPDGKTLVLCGASADGLAGRAWTWRFESGAWRPSPESSLSGVTRAGFSSHSARLAFGTVDGSVILRSLSDGSRTTLEASSVSSPVLSLTFSNDSHLLGVGRKDGSITVWDLDRPAVLTQQTDEDGAVDFIGFCREDQQLVGCSQRRVLWQRDLTGRPGRRLLATVDGTIQTVAVSPQGRYLAAGGSLQEATVWNLETGIRELSYLGSNRFLQHITFGPEGRTVIMNFKDPLIRVWRFRDSADTEKMRQGEGKEAWSLAFSPTEPRLLASGGDDHKIRLWDAETERELLCLSAHEQTVSSLAFLPDGEHLASCGLDGRLFLWKLVRDKEGRILRGDPELLEKLDDRLVSLSLSMDGQMLATAGKSGSVYVWNLKAGTLQRVLSGQTSTVCQVAFSPNPSVLASVSTNSRLLVWNPATGALNLNESRGEEPMRSVAFSNDGMLMAVGGGPKLFMIWSMNTWTLKTEIPGHPLSVRAIAFSPDQRILATGCDDGKVRLWDKDTGGLVFTLSGHAARINCVAFSPDAHILASCDHRGVIHLWRTSDSTPLAAEVRLPRARPINRP